MLQDSFSKVYTKFKMHFYQKMFEKLQERETSLTTVETFCMEIIYALDKPTVAQFADMANISSPNAAYKINNLVKKGYLKKVQSEEDKREYHLEVTQKYIEDRFSKEELETMERMLNVISAELMPEIKY